MNFDRVAPYYESLETIAFGRALQRARTAFLLQIRQSRRALVVGEGNGRFLADLLQANPHIEVDCVDASAGMLRRARNRAKRAVIPSEARDLTSVRDGIASFLAVHAPRNGIHHCDTCRVRFHHLDFCHWQPRLAGYDLVVTHFFLDCFTATQLPRVIDKIGALAAQRSRWLLADFAMPPNGFRKFHAEIWLRAMYSFFGVAAGIPPRRLTDPSPWLRHCGFELREEIVTRFGLIKSQLWQRS